MKRTITAALSIAAAIALLLSIGSGVDASNMTANFTKGDPGIKSMSTLEFGPEGILFIGDSKSGAVFAIDTADNTMNESTEEFEIADLEGQIAALLGTTSDQVLIHDMAVNPTSQNVYVSVSRGRAKWESEWYLPNDLEDASILLRITPDKKITEFKLDKVSFLRMSLPNPVDESKTHRWKEDVTMRTDAITDIVYHNGKLYVAGLSNEEFSAALWQQPFPIEGEATYSTLEIFHGAHGEYETQAPIRTFLPYEFDGKEHILASYLCTPLVTFVLDDLADGKHVKGKTVAEFGSGNFPLDMVLCNYEGKEFVVMANSQLPLLTFDPNDANTASAITKEVEAYTEGVDYIARAGSGIQQLSPYNSKYVLAFQRMPSGKLNVSTIAVARLAM